MLCYYHSVFCSSHIPTIHKKKNIVYDIGQMPNFVQYMVGLHTVDGQYILICQCSSFEWKVRNFEIDGMHGNSWCNLLSDGARDRFQLFSFIH